MIDNSLNKFRDIVFQEKKIVSEMQALYNGLDKSKFSDRNMISSQISSLKNSLKKINNEIPSILTKLFIAKPFNPYSKENFKTKDESIVNEKFKPVKKINYRMPKFSNSKNKGSIPKKSDLSKIEKKTLKRLKKKKTKVIVKKEKKPSSYINLANKIFSEFSMPISKKDIFRVMNKDLVKSHMEFVPATYISTIMFTTLLSLILGVFITIFFLFFNFGIDLPFVSLSHESITTRFLKVFWIIFAVPISTFLIMFFYPSMERKSLEGMINQELPFATLHMSAISGSLVDPSKIFSVIIATKEYPSLEREFTRLINEINIYGYDLVNALRSTAMKTPSKKLAELFNGFATTITSGGDLKEFFQKRSESLLFDYRIEREKYTKSAETFMDIYISVVIAAPMILMLLMILIKVSGLGLSLSTSAISLIMILGVSMMNIFFLTFLYLKQPKI